MKKRYLTFGAPKHLLFANFAGESGGGTGKKKDGEGADKGEDGEGADNEDPDASAELKAIAKISKQVEKFKKTLGEKANAEEIADIKKSLDELKEGIATLTSKEVTELLNKINAANEKLFAQVVEIQEQQNQGTEAGKGAKGVRKNNRWNESITRKSVEDFVKATFEDGEKTHNLARIEIKAAETFGYATFFEGADGTDITAFTGRIIDPTLYQRKRKRNLILDNFDIQNIGVPTLVYLEKKEIGDGNAPANEGGGADWILSGQSKPKRSFRVTSGTVTSKKVAIFGTVEDKLLRDVSSLENWIQEDFMLEMKEKINDGLLNNNPAINDLAPLGLKTNAIQFAATDAFDQTIEDVTYIDALLALFALFIDNKEEAGQAFISADVYFRILSLKDNNARYQNNPLVYTNNLGELYIGGVKITWADSEDVPADHVLVTGVDLGFKIKAYGNMVFERGLNGTDFQEDKTSFRGYQEFLTYIPSNRLNSVLYDSWANIFAAIAKP